VARTVADGILSHEVVTVGGAPLLVAGPWANSVPFVFSPGYVAPQAMSALAAATGDRRWDGLVAASRSVVERLTAGGLRLPPAWASADSSGAVVPTGPPGGMPRPGDPQYDMGAARLVAWMAADCDPAGRRFAAAMNAPLADHPPAASRDLDGATTDRTPQPVTAVAAGLARAAAGRPADAAALLTLAGSLEAQHPTYYGGAWSALGATLWRDPTALGGCRAA
jgi:endoglucanase